MPNRKAKDRKAARRKKDRELDQTGRTNGQRRRYKKKQSRKSSI